MSIRLNKAIKELNIGLQTAVEFLKKRSDLGEVRDDLGFKLNDGQYNALKEEFKSDKEVRSQAEKLFTKHPKEKKRQQERKEHKAEGAAKSTQPQKYTVLGKIDLDSLNKKPAAKTPIQPRKRPNLRTRTRRPPTPPASSRSPKSTRPRRKRPTLTMRRP